MREKGASRREIEERVNRAIEQGCREAEGPDTPEEIKQIVDRLKTKAHKLEGVDEDRFCRKLEELLESYKK
ncbi:MAG: hypothetical protein ABEK10_00225 [Candidatus Nanosalina sp.]